MKGRFLLHPGADGLWNMAVDALLARTASADLCLRCYGWQPWTLSLGHAQKWDEELAARAEASGLPVVRRETGGRAVYHAQELTYSVSIPAGSPFHESNLQTAYARINRALAGGLASLGVDVEQESRHINLREAYRKEMGGLCFAATAQSEVLCDGRKLVGSAQRQLKEGLLQHGSLMMGPAHEEIVRVFFSKAALQEAALDKLRRQTCHLAEIAEDPPPFEQLAEAFRESFSQEYGLELCDQPLSDSESEQIESWRAAFRPEHGSVRLPRLAL